MDLLSIQARRPEFESLGEKPSVFYVPITLALEGGNRQFPKTLQPLPYALIKWKSMSLGTEANIYRKIHSMAWNLQAPYTNVHNTNTGFTLAYSFTGVSSSWWERLDREEEIISCLRSGIVESLYLRLIPRYTSMIEVNNLTVPKSPHLQNTN